MDCACIREQMRIDYIHKNIALACAITGKTKRPSSYVNI